MQTKKTFIDFEKNSAKEQRLVFAEMGSVDTDASSRSLIWSDYPNIKEFTKN